MSPDLARWRPRLLVLMISAGLLAASALAWRTPLPGGDTNLLTPNLAPWMLVPLFAAVEVVVVRVYATREAQAISLSEIPMVLALFLASPLTMLIASVIGAALVFALYHRQSPAKLAFNIALRIFSVTTTLIVFNLIAGTRPTGDPATVSPRLWAAAVAAVVLAGMLDGLVVRVVMAVHAAAVPWEELRKDLIVLPLVSAVVACTGLVAVAALHADPYTGGLLLVVGAGTLAVYRAHSSLNEQRVNLERLYTFSRSVTRAAAAEEIMHSVLAGAIESLRTEGAEVLLVESGSERGSIRTILRRDGEVSREAVDLQDPSNPWLEVLQNDRPLLMTRSSRSQAELTYLAAMGYREAIIVPLRAESGVVGALAVGDRTGENSGFDLEDLQMLERVGGQARLALQNGRMMERLRYESTHDTLTGLANRSTFRASVEAELAANNRGDDPGFAVLLLSVDAFTQVNTSVGYHGGDLLLRDVARRLLDAVPATSIVARLGGDEFAVLVPATTTVGPAAALGAAVREELNRPLLVEHLEVQARVSIGIALAPRHARDVTTLLRAAGSALEGAKSGGSGVRIYDKTDLGPSGQSQLAFVADLRRAMAEGEITVHVQPQAMAASEMVVGVEALVRWNHPTLGVLLPAQFLPLAERHGAMPDLTALVLDQAIAAASMWRNEGLGLTVSVNLSPSSLIEESLIPALTSALETYGLPPHLLTVEITEDSMIADPDQAVALLSQLRALGLGVSVDDFGTGYSSLSHLRRLPATEVKIDKSFVSAMATNADDQMIVRSIIDLAANMALRVVAEGVEDRMAWNQLAGLGCHMIQGYYLAPPMPIDELRPWLAGYHGRLRSTDQPVSGIPPRLRVV